MSGWQLGLPISIAPHNFARPMEDEQFTEGYDPCVHVVRLGTLEDWDTGE